MIALVALLVDTCARPTDGYLVCLAGARVYTFQTSLLVMSG